MQFNKGDMSLSDAVLNSVLRFETVLGLNFHEDSSITPCYRQSKQTEQYIQEC
jgi:hypothetical protein